MMKYWLIWVFCLVVGAVGAAGASETAEKQYAFTEHLLQEGQDQSALLELERFVFYYPQHAQAPTAIYRAARLYYSFADNKGRARKYLQDVITRYPKSPAKVRAEGLQKLINGKAAPEGALIATIRGQDLADFKRYGEAEKAYGIVIDRYGQSMLAEHALFQRGKLRVTQLERYPEARADLERVVRRQPRSRYADEALYLQAESVEKEKGAGDVSVQAYRQAVNRIHSAAWREKAQERIRVLDAELAARRQPQRRDSAEPRKTKDIAREAFFELLKGLGQPEQK